VLEEGRPVATFGLGLPRSAVLTRHPYTSMPYKKAIQASSTNVASEATREGGEMKHIVKNLWVDDKPMTMLHAILSQDETERRASRLRGQWHVTMTCATEQPFNGGDLVMLKVGLQEGRVLTGEAQCAFPYIAADDEPPFSVRRDVFRGRSPLSEAG
jgi:hypothetical protein